MKSQTGRSTRHAGDDGESFFPNCCPHPWSACTHWAQNGRLSSLGLPLETGHAGMNSTQRPIYEEQPSRLSVRSEDHKGVQQDPGD